MVPVKLYNNQVGGNQTGYQLSCINNQVGGNQTGYQLSCINNQVDGNLTGYQLSYINNQVDGNQTGYQLSFLVLFLFVHNVLKYVQCIIHLCIQSMYIILIIILILLMYTDFINVLMSYPLIILALCQLL